MTARPPRASTKGDAKRPKGRAQTQGDKVVRSPSVIQTGRFERLVDDDLLEEVEVSEVSEVSEASEASEVPQLRLLVYEGGPHLATAQAAIVAAGHLVVGAAGREGIDRLRPAVAGADALLIGLPGGEPLIDAARSLESPRPVVIAASTATAVEAVRRAAAAGADLAAVRPHDPERLAPILLAAARLVEQRRASPPSAHLTGPSRIDRFQSAAEQGTKSPYGDGPPGGNAGLETALDELSEAEPGATLQPSAVFQQALALELDRARRFSYPLCVAAFGVDIAPPPAPPGVRGILRARAGNALVQAIRDIDMATELEQDRFLVLMPHTDRLAAAELARRIISAVAAGDPVTAAGRTFPPKVIGAVAQARPSEPQAIEQLITDATQLLEQAQVTGASLAVET